MTAVARLEATVARAAEALVPTAIEARDSGDHEAYADLLDDVTHEFATELGLAVGTPAFEAFVMALDARIATMNGYRTVTDDPGNDFTPFPLEPGARLTVAQVVALQQLERAIVNGRGMIVPVEVAEAVVHEFACQAAGSCCCGTTRPLAGPAV